MDVLRHLVCTVRALGRARTYSVAVIATVALGVMTGAVVFTLYKGALLDPWPYEGGDRLLVFRGDYPALGRDAYPLLSAQDYQDLRELEGIFDHVVAGRGRDVSLFDASGARLVRGAELTPNAFAMLGIEPLHGRLLGEADAAPQAEPAVLIGHGLWQSQYGGNPAALGSKLRVDGVQRTIVGIMPPRFLWWGSEIWLPLRVEPAPRGERSYVVQARLASGVDLQAANAALAVWARRVEQAYASQYQEYVGWSLRVHRLVDEVLRNVANSLAVLLVAVGLLVLVAAFNVATLLLARTSERRREFAVRAALGASAGSVVRSLLAENLVLASLGGLAGMAAAVLVTDLVVALIPYGYFPAEANVEPDVRVFAFAAGVALLVAVLAALPAAAWLRGLNVAGGLGEARGIGARSTVRMRAVFVTAQLTLGTVVVAGALAVAAGFHKKLSVDPGFTVGNAVSMRLALPRQAYPDRPALRRFALDLEALLSEAPGVEAAGIGLVPPLSSSEEHPVSLRAQPGSGQLSGRHEIVAGDWFAALDVPVLAGRVFDGRDRRDAQPVAVVNERFARLFLGGSEALGSQVRAGPGGAERDWLTIVGVVGDTAVGGVDGQVRPLVYQPLAQSQVQLRNATVLARGTAPPGTLVDAVRQAVAVLDPAVPIYEIASFEDIVRNAMGGYRLAVWLLAGFAAAVLLLAALGTYGLVAWMARLARPEMGLRLAVGAKGVDILKLIAARGLLLAGIGAGTGFLVALPALRLVAVLLEEPLPPSLPLLFAAAALLIVVTLVSCAGPALTGARTDPSVALRGG